MPTQGAGIFALVWQLMKRSSPAAARWDDADRLPVAGRGDAVVSRSLHPATPLLPPPADTELSVPAVYSPSVTAPSAAG